MLKAWVEMPKERRPATTVDTGLMIRSNSCIEYFARRKDVIENRVLAVAMIKSRVNDKGCAVQKVETGRRMTREMT